MKLSKFMNVLKKADPKILMLLSIIVVLAVLLVKEKNHACDCPECQECECDVKKKVAFVESSDLIGTYIA